MNIVPIRESMKTRTPIDSARARLVSDDPNKPVQLTLPAKDAALLAYLTDEFARSISPNSDEGDALVEASAAISGILRDVLLARGGV